MTYQPGQGIEVELVIHQRNVRKDGSVHKPPTIWKPATFLSLQGKGALVEYRTPIGVERKVFPPRAHQGGGVTDLTGQKFGYITILWKIVDKKILSELYASDQGGSWYRYRCDCGKLDFITASAVTRTDKPQVSCGCYKQSPEYAAKISAAQKKVRASRPQPHSEETRRKISESMKRSHALRGHKAGA